MGFYNVDSKSDVAQLVTALYKAYKRGDKNLQVNGKDIELETPSGAKRITMDVSLPAKLLIFFNDEQGKASWALNLHDFYAYEQVDMTGEPVSVNPRIAGQVKEGKKGTALFAFRDGSFADGFFACALKAIREHDIPVEYLMDEKVKETALKLGYLNDKGEVLHIPELQVRTPSSKKSGSGRYGSYPLRKVDGPSISELLSGCPEIPDDQAVVTEVA